MMSDLKYIIFFATLLCAVPIGLLMSIRFAWAEKLVFFLVIFFTCNMVDINFVSMEFYRGTSKGFEFGMVDMSMYILLGLIFIRRRQYPIMILPPGSLLYFTYFAFSATSIANADIKLYSAFELVKMVRMYLYFWIIANYLRSPAQLDLLMRCVGIIMFYIFIVVINQKYRLGQFQCAGPFPHQNSLVMYVSVFGALIHAYMLNRANIRAGIWFLLFGMAGICVVASLSRAGLALFAMNSAIVFMLSVFNRSRTPSVRNRKIALAVLIPIAGLAVIIKASDTIIERFKTAPEESKIVRIQLAIAAKNMADDKLFGVGLNNFGLKINPPYPYGAHIPMQDPNDPDEKNGLVETIYLMIAAETGWHNLAVFVVMLLYFYLRNLRNYFLFKRANFRFVAIAFVGALSSIYVQSTLEWVLKQTNNFYQLMLIFGVIVAISRHGQEWLRHESKERKVAG